MPIDKPLGKTKSRNAAIAAKSAALPKIPDELIDQIVKGQRMKSAWGKKFPSVVAAWRRAWDRVIQFFVFPPEVRRVIYTTNAIESINAQLRKIIQSRGHFPSNDAASKLLWLALRNITADWGRAAKTWREPMNQFAILYADRFTRTGS